MSAHTPVFGDWPPAAVTVVVVVGCGCCFSRHLKGLHLTDDDDDDDFSGVIATELATEADFSRPVVPGRRTTVPERNTGSPLLGIGIRVPGPVMAPPSLLPLPLFN